MEFGNLKKRLALGLAGVMAFTMAAPVGLTTGQQGAVSQAATEGFTFIASPSLSAEKNDIIKVGAINTSTTGKLVDEKANQIRVEADSDFGYAAITNGVDKGLMKISAKNIFDMNEANRANVMTPSVLVDKNEDNTNPYAVGKNTGATVYFAAVTPGTANLKITALSSNSVPLEENNLKINITDPDSISFDVRTGGGDKTVVDSITLSNVRSKDVYVKVNTTGSYQVTSLRVDNANVNLLKVATGSVDVNMDDEFKPQKGSIDSWFPVAGNNIAGMSRVESTTYGVIRLVPNKEVYGDTTVNLQVGYTKCDGNGAPIWNTPGDQKWTTAKTLNVKVANLKNTVTASWQGAAETYSVTSEEKATGKLFALIDKDSKVKTDGVVSEGVASGVAIRLNNSNRESQIVAATDKASEGAEVSFSVGNGDNNEKLTDYVSVTKKGLVTLNSDLTKGVTRTGVITVLSTPGVTDKYEASKSINIPVRISNKVNAQVTVSEGDDVIVTHQNGQMKAGVRPEMVGNGTVWLSTNDMPEKTLTYTSNVDPSYIKWTSDKEEVKVVASDDKTIKLIQNKKKAGNVDATITGTVQETPDTEEAITLQFKVRVTDLKIVNPLTYDNTSVYLNYDSNPTCEWTSSFAEGNNVKYEFVRATNVGYDTKASDGVATVDDENLDLQTYGGKITVKNGKNEGVALVRVSGDANSTAAALDYGIIRVYYNIKAEETIDTITTTESKKALTVGETYQISAASAKGDTLVYASDDASVASVDPNTGLVTANKPGMAIVTIAGATYGGEATIAINVSEKAQDQDTITGKTSYSVKVGKTVTSNAESSLGNALTFKSANTDIATVNAKTGVIKGVKAGKATITATAKNSGAELKINVTVSKNNQSLTVTGKKVTKKVALKKNKTTKKITIKKAAALTVKNAQGTVTYKKASGNSKITVNSKTGNITVKKGIKKGTYKVKVTVNAAGNNTYNKASKTATVTIVIKKK